MTDYNVFEMNGQKFEVMYQKKRGYIKASTYVNGRKIEADGDSEETAYWALQQHVHAELNFKL